MSKLHIGVLTSDKSWYRLFDKYIQTHHSGDIALVPCGSSVSVPDQKLDICLIDECGSGTEIESANPIEEMNGKILYLKECLDDSFDEFSVIKYMPADQLVRKLIDMVKGRAEGNEVKHIVVSSASETRLSYEFSEYIASVGSDEKALLLTLANSNTCRGLDNRMVKDPFGRLVYYASKSEGKISGSLESLISSRKRGLYTIDKPYPFDASQWSNNVSANVLGAFDKQSNFSKVVWHLGSVYSLGFGELLNRAHNFIWLGCDSDLSVDKAYGSYQDLSDCRLDLKTSYFSLDALDSDKGECYSKFQHMLKEIKDL